MSNQRYSSSDQRYGSTDNHRPPQRGQSPPRYGGDRYSGPPYGAAALRRGNDYSSRFDDTRDRIPSIPSRDAPRGPRADFDIPRGRGNFTPRAPRGRGSNHRGDSRGDFRINSRDDFREPEAPRGPRAPEYRDDRDRSWREDEVVSRPRGHSPSYRGRFSGNEHHNVDPRDRDFDQGRDTARDRAESEASTSWRGRDRGRGEWSARGRGRGAPQDGWMQQPPRVPSPATEQRVGHDHTVVRSSMEPRDDIHPDRRNLISHDDRPHEGQVFDPFTQNRATARELAQPSRQFQPPTAPSVRDHQVARQNEGLEAIRPTFDEAGPRRTQSFQVTPRSHHLDSRRNSLPYDERDDRLERNMPAPPTSSPPRAPQVPAFGSMSSVTAPTGPRGAPSEPKTARPPLDAPAAPRGPRQIAGLVSGTNTVSERRIPTAPKSAHPRTASFSDDRRPIDPVTNRDPSVVPSSSSTGFHPSTARISASVQPSTNQSFAHAGGMSTSTPLPPPSGPRAAQSSVTAPSIVASVPTGPKAARGPVPPPPPPPPPRNTGSAPWQRAWHYGNQQLPSSSTMLPIKRDVKGLEKSPEAGTPGAQAKTLDSQRALSMALERARDIAKTGMMPKSPATKIKSAPQSPAWGDEPPDFGLVAEVKRPTTDARSVDDEATTPVETINEANEDLIDLDEVDFQHQEEEFQKEKSRLEASMVNISSGSLRCDDLFVEFALLSALQYLVLPQSDETPPLSQGEGDDDSDERLQPSTPEVPWFDPADVSDKYTRDELPLAITDADLSSLPFLQRGSAVTLDHREKLGENLDRQMQERTLIEDRLRQLQRVNDEEEEVLRAEYRTLYRPWIDLVQRYDSQFRVEEPDPDDLPPPLPLLDAPPMQPIIGGRRALTTMNSDFDAMQAVIEESKQTALKEAELRLKKEMSGRFDPHKELIVPALIRDPDSRGTRFTDTRGFCLTEHHRVAYALEPDLDDFTEVEHNKLVDIFKLYPKKWSTIALGVGPHRTYKECIRHYYSSKWFGGFKDTRDKGKRRSKGTGPQRTRRAQAGTLLSNLGDARTDQFDVDEFNTVTMAVTDRGRPRRAAAPSFGAREIEEQIDAAVVASKRTGKSKPLVDQLSEKTTKRSGTGKEKGTKKMRYPQMRQASASPEKMDLETASPSAMPPYGYPAYNIAPGFETDWTHNVEQDPNFPYDLIHARGDMHLDPGFDNGLRLGIQSRRSAIPSSYWSVGETNLFYDLVAQHGSDWTAVSQKLGTKSAVMAKNYYKRQIEKNVKPGLEEDMKRADDRRHSRENRHTFPTTTMSPAQQHITSDVIASQNPDMVAYETAPTALAGHPYLDDQRTDRTLFERDGLQLLPTSSEASVLYPPQQRSIQLSNLSPSARRSAELSQSSLSYPIHGMPLPRPLPMTIVSSPKNSHAPSTRDQNFDHYRSQRSPPMPLRPDLEHTQIDPHDPRLASVPADYSRSPRIGRLNYHEQQRESQRRPSSLSGQTFDHGMQSNYRSTTDGFGRTEETQQPWQFPSSTTRSLMSPFERPPSVPLAPPAAAPKRSNLSSILNAEPGESLAQHTLQQRSQTTPYPGFSTDRLQQQSGPNFDRLGTTEPQSYNRFATGLGSRTASHEEPSRPPPDRPVVTPDWTSGVRSPADPYRSYASASERLAPSDAYRPPDPYRREAVQNLPRFPTSPQPPMLEFGRMSQQRPQSGADWRDESLRARQGSRDEQRELQTQRISHGERYTTEYQAEQEIHSQGRMFQPQQGELPPPEQTMNRHNTTRVRGDDFLMNGSGSYRSLSAQRDAQRDYHHQQHLTHNSQTHQQPQPQQEFNPFLQIDGQTRRQPIDVDNLPPTAFPQPERDQRTPVFGRIGPSDQGSSNHQQQE